MLYGAGGERAGMLEAGSNTAYYELSDHLGNVRTVITAKAGTQGGVDIVEAGDYYPHGGILPGTRYVAGGSMYRYGYQGQERDAESGLTNFELRQYDPRLGRWNNPDPYGQHHSPYLAMSNNPVNSVDPDGGWDEDVYKWIVDAPELISRYNQMSALENDLRMMETYGMQGSAEYSQLVSQQRHLTMKYNAENKERGENVERMMAMTGHLYINGEWAMSGRQGGSYYHDSEGKPFVENNTSGNFGIDIYTREEVLAWHGLSKGGWRENGRGYAQGVNMKELKAYADGLEDFGEVAVKGTGGLLAAMLSAGVANEVYLLYNSYVMYQGAAGATLAELQTIVKAQSPAFRELFGRGKEGAANVLKNLDKVKLPEGLTKKHIESYLEITKRVPDPTGTQELRRQILETILKTKF